jgi:hypothetical protein
MSIIRLVEILKMKLNSFERDADQIMCVKVVREHKGYY